ncbi:hypothetical protein BDV11DRAFT_194712 [Aspergillus similis]
MLCHATCHLSLGMLPGDRASSQDRTDPESDQVCTTLCAVLEVGSEASAGGAHRVRLPLIIGAWGPRASSRATVTGEIPEDQWVGKAKYTVLRTIMHFSVAGSSAGSPNNRCRALAPYPTIQKSDRICCPSSLSSLRPSHTEVGIQDYAMRK